MHRLAEMSFLEPAAHSRVRIGNVRFGSKADIWTCVMDVRFTPESGHFRKRLRCPLSAKSGHRLTIEPAENPAGDSIVVGSVIRRPLFLRRADDL